jgi:hypothetical protein
MTKLTGDKTVSRETAILYRGRHLCFEAHPNFIVMWIAGKKTKFLVHYDAIFDLSQKLGLQYTKPKKEDLT